MYTNLCVCVALSATAESPVRVVFETNEGASVDIKISAPEEFRQQCNSFVLSYAEGEEANATDQLNKTIEFPSNTRSLWLGTLKSNADCHFKLSCGEVTMTEQTMFILPDGKRSRHNIYTYSAVSMSRFNPVVLSNVTSAVVRSEHAS